MRYLAILLAALVLFAAPLPASAALRGTSSGMRGAAAKARPIATFKDRFGRTADRIAAKIVQLLPPAFQPTPGAEDADVPKNKMATTAMICGIAGYLLFWPALPVALVTGIIALKQIRETGEAGKGRAIAGIVLGGAPIAAAIVVFAWINGQ